MQSIQIAKEPASFILQEPTVSLGMIYRVTNTSIDYKNRVKYIRVATKLRQCVKDVWLTVMETR